RDWDYYQPDPEQSIVCRASSRTAGVRLGCYREIVRCNHEPYWNQHQGHYPVEAWLVDFSRFRIEFFQWVQSGTPPPDEPPVRITPKTIPIVIIVVIAGT